MAHVNTIEDNTGNVVDLRYYCSDWCAKFDTEIYKGWYGCFDLDQPEECHTCNTPLGYIEYIYPTKGNGLIWND